MDSFHLFPPSAGTAVIAMAPYAKIGFNRLDFKAVRQASPQPDFAGASDRHASPREEFIGAY